MSIPAFGVTKCNVNSKINRSPVPLFVVLTNLEKGKKLANANKLKNTGTYIYQFFPRHSEIKENLVGRSFRVSSDFY